MNDIEQATLRFCNELNELRAAYDKANGFTVYKTTATFRKGRKFFRVQFTEEWPGRDPHNTSIWFIVDKDTGVIYKPAGYQGGPANRIVRGSVLRPAGDFWNRTITPHGIADAR